VLAERHPRVAVLVVEHAVLAVLAVEPVHAVGVERVGRVVLPPAVAVVDAHGAARAAVVVRRRVGRDRLCRAGGADQGGTGQRSTSENGGDPPVESGSSHPMCSLLCGLSTSNAARRRLHHGYTADVIGRTRTEALL